MKQLISLIAISGFILAENAVQPAYADATGLPLPRLPELLMNGDNKECNTPAANSGKSVKTSNTSSDGKSEGPAPNSGDGIPDGSGMDSPYGKKK